MLFFYLDQLNTLAVNVLLHAFVVFSRAEGVALLKHEKSALAAKSQDDSKHNKSNSRYVPLVYAVHDHLYSHIIETFHFSVVRLFIDAI